MTWMIVLGISSSLCWGTADFFGGLQSRRYPALTVALWSQIVSGVVLLIVTLLSGQQFVLGSVAWGVVGGLFGGMGLLLFYRALATGVMSLVAPITACGAIVPVVADALRGQVPTLLPSLGIVAAIAGVILVSLQSDSSPTSVQRSQTIMLSLAAALGFGLFFVFLAQGTDVSTAGPLWVVAGARAGSLVLLGTITATTARSAPVPVQHLVPIGLIGILDTLANILFTYASAQGQLAIVAVLGSLYPVATVLLGRLILAERLNLVQGAGVALALSGVALLSAG